MNNALIEIIDCTGDGPSIITLHNDRKNIVIGTVTNIFGLNHSEQSENRWIRGFADWWWRINAIVS